MKQNLIDKAEFTVKAGNGGRGAVSFRREKYVPKGGPDGGAGGRGGSIVLRVNPNLNTLRFFAGKHEFVAQSGEGGGRQKRYGEDGEDTVLEVPEGTVVYVKTEEYRLLSGRRFHGDGAEELKHSGMKVDTVDYAGFDERWGLQSQSSKLKAQNDNSELKNENREALFVQVADLDAPDMALVLAKGGRGGKGNFVYRSSTLTTPTFAQTGEKGELFHIRLEMKVLADVGLVGLPNAGKSTLLSVLTSARPEIADYPFTTLSPNLGVLQFDQDSSGKHDLVIADIPGLIEDAHTGKGLGDEFLRHVERCEVLVYVIAPTVEMLTNVESENVKDGEISNSQFQISKQDRSTNDQISNKIAKDLWKQFEVVKGEVISYKHDLEHKKYMILLNKVDLLSTEIVSSITSYFEAKGEIILPVSAATTEGITELKSQLLQVA